MQGLHKFVFLHVLTCLGRNGNGSQIIDGDIVPENSMQYMVSLWNSDGHVCGGFLVSETFVVTAAHCDEKKPTIAYFGHHNKQEFKEYRHFNTFKRKTYENVAMGNDIMLLKLNTKVELGGTVQTIQLPASDVDIQTNEQCYVVGWGVTEPNGTFVDKLRKGKVSVIDLQACKEREPSLPENVICTDGQGANKRFCEGDHGGPLVCNEKAVGVVSFNKDCTDLSSPNVYTDISKYLPWIKVIMTKHKD